MNKKIKRLHQFTKYTKEEKQRLFEDGLIRSMSHTQKSKKIYDRNKMKHVY